MGKRHLVLVSLVTAGVGATFISAGQSAPAAPAALPPIALAAAQRVAAINGDRAPAKAEWVQTTRGLAVASQSSDVVDSNQDVYFIILHGHFVDHHAYAPPGAPDPTGTVLSLTVDVASGQVLDEDLTNVDPTYKRTGPPTTFSMAGG